MDVSRGPGHPRYFLLEDSLRAVRYARGEAVHGLKTVDRRTSRPWYRELVGKSGPLDRSRLVSRWLDSLEPEPYGATLSYR